jgi:hypothetical protein
MGLEYSVPEQQYIPRRAVHGTLLPNCCSHPMRVHPVLTHSHPILRTQGGAAGGGPWSSSAAPEALRARWCGVVWCGAVCAGAQVAGGFVLHRPGRLPRQGRPPPGPPPHPAPHPARATGSRCLPPLSALLAHGGMPAFPGAFPGACSTMPFRGGASTTHLDRTGEHMCLAEHVCLSILLPPSPTHVASMQGCAAGIGMLPKAPDAGESSGHRQRNAQGRAAGMPAQPSGPTRGLRISNVCDAWAEYSVPEQEILSAHIERL